MLIRGSAIPSHIEQKDRQEGEWTVSTFGAAHDLLFWLDTERIPPCLVF